MSRPLSRKVGLGAVAVIAAAAAVAVTVLPAAPPAVPNAPKPAPKKVQKPPAPVPPKTAPSRVTAVTIYQNNALVTREVAVPEGAGTFELVVAPLPPQTVDQSLYSEGTNGVRVLTTRYRMRPIREDTREEVRKAEARMRELQTESRKLQSDIKVVQQNLDLLTKLENFANANLQHQTEKGTLNSEAVMALCKYVMEGRAEKTQDLVRLNEKVQENQEQIEFVQRQMRDLAAGSNKTEREAVIVVDKGKAGPGKIRLNYLVNSASWRPQYKFRAGKENQPIMVEYLAAVTQQTGEDWTAADLTLSTAEPKLTAAPPDLGVLEVAVVPRNVPQAPMANAGGMGGSIPAMQPPASYALQSQQLRGQAKKEISSNNFKDANKLVNQAAAVEQAQELVAARPEDLKNPGKGGWRPANNEGPSVTYHLATPLTVPSRNDEQVLEVARIEMQPEYFYKAIPVLTQHVYRLANLTNKSDFVLLPGEATMYIGTDFVGRATLPLVAIGEQFTASFGVDPQLQVQRQLMDKTRATQGDNQVLKYEYRILVSSYKTEPVKLQLWDRLPHADTEAVGVSLVKTAPELSTDAMYLRENRPGNLLRWDLTVEPTMNGEKALAVKYEFKLELGRQMKIHSFAANANVGIPIPMPARR